MSSEDPETYLRRFAEAQLRRLAAGEATAAECAARVDTVAAAFEETGALDRTVTSRVGDSLHVALMARSPDGSTPSRAGRLGYSAVRRRPSAGVRCSGARSRSREAAPGNITVVPAGTLLRSRGDGGHGGNDGHDRDNGGNDGGHNRGGDNGSNGNGEDVYLLDYVSLAGRAWFSVAARTSEPLVPRRHASPPSARNPRALPSTRYRPTFAGSGMTATDDAGRAYRLRFSGGGGEWYLGRLAVHPVPPPETAWLEVRCGRESARINLRATAPAAEVTARPLADERGEDYLLRQAESLLVSPDPGAGLLAAKTTGLCASVPALRATGLLPAGSPVPGQVAALIERLGGPGRLIAEPGELPERWAARAAAGSRAGDRGPVAAASLATVLPEVDGVTVHLAGLITLPGAGTTIFAGIRAASFPDRALWLRDDAGGWHSVSIQGSSRQGNDHLFQATVEPALGPDTTRVEFCVTGSSTEIRAGIPLTWWTP